MRRSISVLAFAAFSVAAQSAGAALIDTVSFGVNGINPSSDSTPAVLNGYGYGEVNRLDGPLDFVSWTHKFSLAPGAKVQSGVLALSLSDDDIDDGIEIGFGFSEDMQWTAGIVSTGTYKYDIGLNSLLDGSFTVTVVSLIGDFLLNKAELKIEYTSVPEPATLSLLGFGVLGAALGYRRRAAKKLEA